MKIFKTTARIQTKKIKFSSPTIRHATLEFLRINKHILELRTNLLQDKDKLVPAALLRFTPIRTKLFNEKDERVLSKLSFYEKARFYDKPHRATIGRGTSVEGPPRRAGLFRRKGSVHESAQNQMLGKDREGAHQGPMGGHQQR